MADTRTWRPWHRRLLTDESPYDYAEVEVIRQESQPSPDTPAQETASPIGAPGHWNAHALWWRPLQ